MINVDGRRVTAQTKTLRAVFEDGRLTSLRDAAGRTLAADSASGAGCAIQLEYVSGEMVDVVGPRGGEIAARKLSDRLAQIRFSGWDADGLLTIREDPADGSLCVEPSAYSTRPGVLSCRWNIGGIDPATELVAPLFQGVRLRLDDPLIANTKWGWPQSWEAGFAIMHRADHGFWVHARDTSFRYKSLAVGAPGNPYCISVASEAYGPVDGNLSGGGLAWRLNTYQGDWRVPAAEYREWLWAAYGLARRQASRPEWTRGITMAVNWCSSDLDLLDALAEKVSPAKTFLHFSEWRTDPYDENYPTFEPSPAAEVFVEKGTAMGFRIAPHANSIDMDPSHPFYAQVRDFCYRDVRTKSLHGWAWDNGSIEVPSSGSSLVGNRSKKVMVKIHPGLSHWRSHLAGAVAEPMTKLRISLIFLDVTLCSGNLHNCLVENMTSSEGMLRLIDEVARLAIPNVAEPVVVAGEGLNEVTVQGLSFAQAHLFSSHQASIKGLARCGGAPVNALLFDGICRTTGYNGLSGRSEDEAARMRTHVSLGAIPTISNATAESIRNPNPAVKEMIDLANAG